MKSWFILLNLTLFALASLAAGPWQGFTALAISPDGQTFATGGREGEVLWGETSTGEILGRWVMETAKPVVALTFDDTGKRLGVVALDGSFAEGDWGRGFWRFGPTIPASWTSLNGAVDRWIQTGPLSWGIEVAYAERVALGSPEGVITISRLSDGQKLVIWSGHQAAITGLAWSKNAVYLLSCSYDGVLARWDPGTGKLLGRL